MDIDPQLIWLVGLALIQVVILAFMGRLSAHIARIVEVVEEGCSGDRYTLIIGGENPAETVRQARERVQRARKKREG